MQDVADSFPGGIVSTSLWDDITTLRVSEFNEGDDRDGYVVEDEPDPRTGIVVTYPKFTTGRGTMVSFKMGVWDPETQSYDAERLKVINVPVLKSHSIYGVTASVKHYMGVVSDKLSSQMGGRAHRSVGAGGMGTEMAATRPPALNLLDAIWINANPRDGPCTPYNRAANTRIIAASTDPIALDYWAAKNVLMPTARKLGYVDLSSMDPDNDSPGSFGRWLKLSKEEMRRGGLVVNGDEGSLNVYVASLDRV